MKNKKCTITLLLCTLLPTVLHGMRFISKPKPIKLPPTTPVIRLPQPKIEPSPIEQIKTPSTGTNKNLLPYSAETTKGKPSILPLEPIKSLEPTAKFGSLTTQENSIEYYKELAKNAQQYDLKFAQYNPKTKKYKYIEYNKLIELIEKKMKRQEDFSKDEIVNIRKVFNVLPEKIKLKKLTITLDDLIIKAQKEGITDKDLQEFKQLTQIDINSVDEVIDIFKEKADEQIKALESLIEKQQAAKELKLAEKAAEQKAAEEQAQLKTENLKKEVDQLHKEIKKEFADEQPMEQKRIAAEAKIKEIEQEQEKAAANQKEQEKLLNEITESELTLEQIERAQQERKKAIEELQKEWDDTKAALDAQTQKEQQAHTAQQEIEATRRKEELKEIKTEKERAARKARKAEQKAQEEQQKLDQTIIKLQEAETRVQTKEKELTQDAQAIEQLETELAELKSKHQSVLEKMAQAKSHFIEEQEKIKAQAKSEKNQMRQDTAAKVQEAQNTLKKSQDFIAKNTEQKEVDLDALEKKYNEEAMIKQQSIEKNQYDQLKHIREKYEQELRLIEQELEQFLKQQTKKQETIEAEQQAQQQAKLEKQQLEDAIKADELALREMQRKQQELLQQKNDSQSKFAEQQQLIEQKHAALEKTTQENIEKTKQKIKELQETEAFKQLEYDQQEKELRELEASSKTENLKKIEENKQKLEAAQKNIAITYEQETKRLDEQLAEAETNRRQARESLEAERAKAEERKKEEENREKERQEREKREKAEGGGDSSIPHGTNIQPDQTKIEEPNQENGTRNERPHISITPHQEIPISQEKEGAQAITLPHVTPEITPTQQKKESQPIFEEPVEQATEESTYPTTEQPTYYPTGSSAGKTAGRPTPSSTSTSQGQTPSSFAPSPSYGGGTPSSAESIGWTSSDPMNPYTQRIEWQKNFASKEEATAAEIERQKKVQLQDTVWWENILPQWVVQYLGRKDRNLAEKPTAEKPTPISSPEEAKNEKPKPGIVQTFIETIKKPISNAVSYIRGLFYG